MVSWTKETALSELDSLITEIGNLSTQHRYSADHVRWVARTLAFLEEVFGRDSRYYLAFDSFEYAQTGSFFSAAQAIQKEAGIRLSQLKEGITLHIYNN